MEANPIVVTLTDVDDNDMDEAPENLPTIDSKPKIVVESAEGVVLDFICFLEGAKVRMRELHWEAKKNNIHLLTDKLIDLLNDYEDEIAEIYMGIIGIRIKVGDVKPAPIESTDLNSLLVSISDNVSTLIASIESDNDFRGIVTVLDDLQKEVEKSKYLATME